MDINISRVDVLIYICPTYLENRKFYDLSSLILKKKMK